MDNDETGHEYSALGICRCLRMLAEEAASMNLPESARTLREAIRVCERESSLGRAGSIVVSRALLN